MSNSITVAVGSPDDLRSSIWRLWVQGDEVYFGAIQLLPALKVSLHKSGDWRIAWHKSLKRPDSNRVLCRWRKPPAIDGVLLATNVIVDPFFSREPFKNRAITDPDIKWLPLALYGKILTLKILFISKGSKIDSSQTSGELRILKRIPKSNGETVCLIAQDIEPPSWVWTSIAKWRSEVKIHFKPEDMQRANLLDTTRAISVSLPEHPHEAPVIYDLSLGWENVTGPRDLT